MPAPVYLVRHGQSEWNVLRLTQGQTRHPRLTDLGREQARVAGDLLAGCLPAGDHLPAGKQPRLLTSDLVRAHETATIVGERLGVEPVVDVRLREQHLGTLEGRGYDETWAAHDWSDPALRVPGGESALDVGRRVAAVLAEADPEVVTVLVTHGDSIRAVLARLGELAPHEAAWAEVPNGFVVRLDGEVSRLA
ncbi:MAG: histidine phosphatase family protein [Nocardioidaceae bacterium]|nr:histidine phosphatase family protein [Nocardioidaceae bacterium]MCL2613668.1 histidine phosphatase family protein [Nocardioidaceae bacterium]